MRNGRLGESTVFAAMQQLPRYKSVERGGRYTYFKSQRTWEQAGRPNRSVIKKYFF
jgi:hypothetical protein